MLTPDMLYEKFQTLLLQLTCNISQEVGKLSQELRGEIDKIGECTDMLETKFDDMIEYVHVLEEDNSSLKHSVSQMQLHQEDLENRQCWQNVHIRGVSENVHDNKIHSYLLGLFNHLAPDVTDIDWCLDRAERSLASKPPAGARPRNIVECFHYYDSQCHITKTGLVMIEGKSSRSKVVKLLHQSCNCMK